MAINTYSTLRTAVAGTAKSSWAHRSDLLDNFDAFLDLAQEEMYQGPPGGEGLRVREMEVRYTASLDATTPSRFLALPANFIEVRRAELEYSSVAYKIKYVPAATLMEIGTGEGMPSEFTVSSQFEFNIAPDVAYTFELQMYGKVANSSGSPIDLTSTNTTHTILTRFPSIYLYGCLYQAFKWAQNFEKAGYYGDLFRSAIEQANTNDKWGRIGPVPQMHYTGSMP